MGALRVERLPVRIEGPYCEADGCSRGDRGRRKAAYRLWLLSRPTAVCRSCCRGMADAYERAAAGFPEEQEAAA